MYVCVYHLPHKRYLQYKKQIQYNTLRLKCKSKIPLITVAGIALKGQADLISIMVSLEVLVQQKKREKGKQESTAVVISTKHGLWDKNMVGRDEEGS